MHYRIANDKNEKTFRKKHLLMIIFIKKATSPALDWSLYSFIH